MVSDRENIQGAAVWCEGNALSMSKVRGEQTNWWERPQQGNRNSKKTLVTTKANAITTTLIGKIVITLQKKQTHMGICNS